MKIGYRLFKYFAFIVIAFIAIDTTSRTALAQAPVISIEFFSPPEGATFYAGPTSLAYNIPIMGRVNSAAFDLGQIEVQLDILQDHLITQTQTKQAHPDGTFEFNVMVNPEGSGEVFGPDVLYCGDICHFTSSISFPNGQVHIRLTATDPSGEQAHVERNIIIDRSEYIDIPIKVVDIDAPSFPIVGLPVNGSTWIYMWRARHATHATDRQGIAVLQVEALTQASTRYIFEVEPTVIQGLLYESVEPVEVILPAGAQTIDPVTLHVKSSRGNIQGELLAKKSLPEDPITIWAIHVPEGDSYRTIFSPKDRFAFRDIPVGEYLLTANKEETAAHGYLIADRIVNLVQSPDQDVDLDYIPVNGNDLHGSVLDIDGDSIPFAWISIEEISLHQSVFPGSGAYSLVGLAPEPYSVLVSAPGYYSQARTVDSAKEDNLDFELTLMPETQILEWGDSCVTIPPETNIYQNGSNISLEYGWIWGKNGDSQSLSIDINDNVISVEKGEFAVEYLPGKSAWLYLLDGAAVLDLAGSRSLEISSGQMVNLLNKEGPNVVEIDPVIMDALTLSIPSQIDYTFQPTLVARIGENLAHLGVNLAQVFTLLAYIIAAISLVSLPLAGIYWWRKNKTR